MKQWVFFLGLGALFTHELDAVANHEWRVLPLVRYLPEADGMVFFIIMHVPLFAIVTALVASPNPKTQVRSRLGVSLFLIVHGVLHALFANHPNYEFSSALSNMLIFGGSILGGIHVLGEIRDRYGVAT